MSFKYKPSKQSIEKWLKECEIFREEIHKLEQKFNITIHVNKKTSSVYFELNDKTWRISTHHKPEWSTEFKPADNNIVTNSKTNILKHIKDLLNDKKQSNFLTGQEYLKENELKT